MISAVSLSVNSDHKRFDLNDFGQLKSNTVFKKKYQFLQGLYIIVDRTQSWFCLKSKVMDSKKQKDCILKLNPFSKQSLSIAFTQENKTIRFVAVTLQHHEHTILSSCSSAVCTGPLLHHNQPCSSFTMTTIRLDSGANVCGIARSAEEAA